MNNPILTELQAQHWVMEPTALQSFIERIAALPTDSSLYAIKVVEKRPALFVADGVARIRISGYLLDQVPGWMRAWGIEATSYAEIRSQLTEATGRPDVGAIQLVVNSPGGMVAGVIGAADAIYEARQAKPVHATVESLAASGAYWLASQAETITADDANAAIGSIGVYTYYVDYSACLEKEGIRVIVVRSGEYKGTGLDEVTDNQIAAAQQYIDAAANNFINQVARGRGSGTAEIAELATGQLWIAYQARDLGLIDAVRSSSAAAEPQSVNAQSANKIKGVDTMDKEKKTEPDVKAIEAAAGEQALEQERARVTAIGTEFADDPQFAFQAAQAGWSLDQAKAEYCTVLRARLTERPKTEPAAAAGPSGHAPIEQDHDATGSAGDFIAEAVALARLEKITKTQAMRQLKRQKPEAYQEYLDRCNSSGREMFEMAR